MAADAMRFEGKYALVVGGSSGMGRAAAQILVDRGARVTVMDIANVKQSTVQSVHLDLREQESIDRAIGSLDHPVDMLFCCAGVAEGTPCLELINFVGQRHLIERMVDEKMARGSAVGVISSLAGLGWEGWLSAIEPVLETPDFVAASSWFRSNPAARTYRFSKRLMSAYVARQAFPLLAKGVRINAILPGPTDTPFTQADPDLYFGFGLEYRRATQTVPSTPEEQAWPLVFLCSQAASHISGANLVVDNGCSTAALSGVFETKELHGMLARP